MWSGIYILYINLVCRNDAIIMQYIIYSTLERPDIQNIGPVVGVQGCDIALGPSVLRLYHILEHPPQVLYFVYKTYCILCVIYIMVQRSTCKI